MTLSLGMFAGSSSGAQGSWPSLVVPLASPMSLSFSYPPRWHALGATFVTSHYLSLAFVASGPLHPPCLEAPAPCNPEAIDSLGPGGVYVRWLQWGWPTP